MNSWFFTIIFFVVTSSQVFAQSTEKKIWALVIGISEYRHFNSLQYADDDALSFYRFLKANYGDRLKEGEDGNVKILLNDQATGAAITSAFSWLVRSVSEGDEVYIYYSGHGATEDITAFKLGYLVGHDCFDQSYSNGGTLPMFYLQRILETLALKNARTYFFADACHSGKKDGEDEDLEYLNSVLGGTTGGVTKILASQGKELSWEHPKWGGGHGVFTYYLMQGLLGEADTDPNDQVVTVRELNNYLDSTIPKATSYLQNPRIISDSRNTAIARIDTLLLLDLRKEFIATKNQIESGQSLASRGIAEFRDPELKRLFEKLKANFNEKNVLDGFDTFIKMSEWVNNSDGTVKEDFNRMRPFVADLLFIAGMDYTQRYINYYLENDHFNKDEADILTNDCLSIINLLYNEIEKDDYRYGQVATRKFFFEAEDLHERYHFEKIKAKELKIFSDANQSILSLDSTAAYLQYQMAVLYYHSKEYQKAEFHSKKAIQLAPSWSYPYNNLGNIQDYQKKYSEAIESFKKGITDNSQIKPTLYGNIALSYMKLKDYDNAFTNYKKSNEAIFSQSGLSYSYIDSLFDLSFFPSENLLTDFDEDNDSINHSRELIYKSLGKSFDDFSVNRFWTNISQMFSIYEKTKKSDITQLETVAYQFIEYDKFLSLCYNILLRSEYEEWFDNEKYFSTLSNDYGFLYLYYYINGTTIAKDFPEDEAYGAWKYFLLYKYDYIYESGGSKKSPAYFSKLESLDDSQYFFNLMDRLMEFN